MIMRFFKAIVLILFCNSTFAQDIGIFHQLAIGGTNSMIDDPSVATIALNGKGVNVSYGLLKFTPVRKTMISMKASGIQFGVDNTDARAMALSLGLSDGFLIFKNRNRRLGGYIGYALHTSPSFLEINDKTNKYYTWSTISSLAFFQSYSYRCNRSSFTIDINVPLIGAASRPSATTVYSEDMNGAMYDSYSNLQLVTPNKYKAIDLAFDYRLVINMNLQFTAGIRYSYADLKTSLPVVQRSAGIQAGLLLRVK